MWALLFKGTFEAILKFQTRLHVGLIIQRNFGSDIKIPNEIIGMLNLQAPLLKSRLISSSKTDGQLKYLTCMLNFQLRVEFSASNLKSDSAT